MMSKYLKTFMFLLFSFLIHFIQSSLCDVEFNGTTTTSISRDIRKRVAEKSIEIKMGDPRFFLAIFGITIFFMFLVLCYLIAFCVNRKGDNSVIFSIPWTLLDFILDVLFFLNKAKYIPWLYTPSLTFLILPVVVNIVLSFIIITNEKRRGSLEFRKWFYNHSALAAMATVFAAADMSTLKLLSSNLFRLKRFQAPFSDDTKNLLLWGCVVSSILEDLPQFVIQVLYRVNTGQGDTLLPFLNLFTASIKLPIGIIGRVFEALNGHRKPGKDDDAKDDDAKDDDVKDDDANCADEK